MNKFKNFFLKQQILGYRVGEIFGIILLVIPFIITLPSYECIEKILIFEKKEEWKFQPGLISTLFAAIFYLALILRFKFFKNDNFINCIISVARAFFNIYLLSCLLSIIIGTKNEVFGVKYSSIVIFAIIITWLGIKTIAGYSWILFIVLATSELAKADSAMGLNGAFFIIFLTLSLLLQIDRIDNLQSFIDDFRGFSEEKNNIVKEDIQESNEVTKKGLNFLKSKISKK